MKISLPAMKNGVSSASIRRCAVSQAAAGVGEALEQDRELVAAEPGRGVGAAEHRLQPGRDVDEEPVAHGVAEAVVDGLERVEVDEQHRRGAIGSSAGASRGRRDRRTAPGWAGW